MDGGIPASSPAVRVVTPATRRLLVGATVLVVLAGTSLYLAPEQTADWFAWTVTPPVTATVLGAAYWASAVVEWTSARATAWADARIAVPSVFTFTVLTLVVTLVHLDRFHVGAENALRPQVIAWAWLAIYAVVPVLLGFAWWGQRRVAGVDPARHPLPPVARATCVAMAVVLGTQGLLMLLAPAAVVTWWPWDLTDLTARAIGAWLVGLAVSAAGVARENDACRSRPVAWGALVLPALAGIGLARYSDDVDWASAGSWAVLAVLVAWAVLGGALVALGRGCTGGASTPTTREVPT
jgi:hypothetical protein